MRSLAGEFVGATASSAMKYDRVFKRELSAQHISSWLASFHKQLGLYSPLFRGQHRHKVPPCPVAGRADSYVDPRGFRGKETVTMATKTPSLCQQYPPKQYISSPPPPSVMPRLVCSQKEQDLSRHRRPRTVIVVPNGATRPPAPPTCSHRQWFPPSHDNNLVLSLYYGHPLMRP